MFFLGYASNSKTYQVFNQDSGLVEETCDVEFDESNGSQEEVVGYELVGDQEAEDALKNMSVGDVKLKEVQEINDQGRVPSSTPSTSMFRQVDEDEEKDDPPLPLQDVLVPDAQDQDHNVSQYQPQVEPQVQQSQPLVKHGRFSKDHPLDQVIESPSRGVRTLVCFIL